MKKLILPLLFMFGALHANAQCVPGILQGTGSSYILPDSATNMMDACTGSAYEQIMYLRVAGDTTITLTTPISTTLTADIDSFVINSTIGGLPTYFSVASVPAALAPAANNPNTNYTRLVVKGDSMACVRIWGNVPANATAGTNPIIISVRAYLSNIHSVDVLYDPLVPGFFPNRKVDTPVVINDYRIIVKTAPCYPAAISNLQAYQFDLIGAIPNPADNRTQIVFNSSKIDNYSLKIVNALGEVMLDKKMKSALGLNYIQVDADQWAKGIYMYSLSDGKNMISNKLQLR